MSTGLYGYLSNCYDQNKLSDLSDLTPSHHYSLCLSVSISISIYIIISLFHSNNYTTTFSPLTLSKSMALSTAHFKIIPMTRWPYVKKKDINNGVTTLSSIIHNKHKATFIQTLTFANFTNLNVFFFIF